MNRFSSHDQLSPLEKFADRCTQWIGSSGSLVFHTGLFVVFAILGFLGVSSWTNLLLILTTLVSLEAIYLSIFIQISLNRNTRSLEVVEENIDEIQENVGDIEESLEDLELDSDYELTNPDEATPLPNIPETIDVVLSRFATEDPGDIQNMK